MRALADCRILLVDDAKANLDVLVEGLKSDYKLSVAMSGEKALAVAALTPPDLVLLDIVMPDLDGYEVCRRLRDMPATADVPIMFLSSLEEVRDKTRGFEAGANDYVTKPFDMLEVKARVRSLLKAKAYNDAVKEEIASELRIARQIQMGMLPKDFPAVGERYGICLDAVLEPAREVGGDLYGLCEAGAERLVLFLGDVSGKGIPASMVMVRAINLARLLARDIAEPERILARLNDELATDNPSGMFVTFICVMFEPASNRLVIANAGHCRPLLLPRHAPPRWAVERLGTALGLEPGLEFERTELMLAPGDTLILYSDGVTEAFNQYDECFGTGQLLANTTTLAGQSATAITSNLLQAVRAFAGRAPQSDDIAILSMRVNDASRRSLVLRATPAEVMRGVDALREFAAIQGLHERAVFELALALEECGSNVVDHGLKRDSSRTFEVMFERTPESFVIELRDDGPEFDPTSRASVPPQAPDENDLPGGWGLALVRRNVDDVRYSREAGRNVLRLTKRLVSAAAVD